MSRPLIYAAPSHIEGIGAFAGADIPAKTCVQMIGMLMEYEDKHCLEYDEDYFFRPMTPFMYLNHSSEPNCQVFIDEESGMYYLEFLKDVEYGYELTIDYGNGDDFDND